ncbi:hypothetical protein D3C72_2056780 [compost metagenome]
MLARQAGDGQRVVVVDLAEGGLGTRGAHGGAQRADHRVGAPPVRLGRKTVEVGRGAQQLGMRGQRTPGDRDHFPHPGIGQRLVQHMAANQAGRSDQQQLHWRLPKGVTPWCRPPLRADRRSLRS